MTIYSTGGEEVKQEFLDMIENMYRLNEVIPWQDQFIDFSNFSASTFTINANKDIKFYA